VAPATGAVVHAFTSGAMVQVFLLARGAADSAWNSGTHHEDRRMPVSPHDEQTISEETPLGLREIDRIVGQTSNLVRQMMSNALAKIRKLLEIKKSS
jgi:hypothetical protein